jgi:hypothetical protein
VEHAIVPYRPLSCSRVRPDEQEEQVALVPWLPGRPLAARDSSDSPDDESEPSIEIEPACLEQACQGVLRHLYCDITTFAIDYDVPEDVLEVMVVDWLYSRFMGRKAIPADVVASIFTQA